MNFLLLETFLLLIASYFLGAALACMAKRAMFGTRDAVPEFAEATQYAAPAPVRASPGITQPARQRMTPPPVAPRPIDPIQPRIEVLRRPDPRAAPKLVDPSRFERALMGPDPNEGMPRNPIIEIMPAVFKSPTGPPHPVPKPAPPKPEPVAIKPVQPAPVISDSKPVTAKASGPVDATTSAAAAAVALSQAAAAASIAATASKSQSVADAEREPEPEIADQPDEPSESPHDEHEERGNDEERESLEAPAEPVLAPTPPPVERKRIETGDDFQRIRAIDDATEQDLKTLGFTYFEDIAGWTPDDVKRIDQTLRLNGRIDREQWIEQAQILAKGGETYYSRNRPGAQKAKSSPSDISVVAPLEDRDDHETSEQHGEERTAEAATPAPSEPDIVEKIAETSEPPAGMSAAFSGRSVAEMAAAAAAAIAAASASVTRGLKPIEPISPLSKVDPKISIPARLTDAIKEREATARGPAADLEPESEQLKPLATPAETSDDLKRIRGVGVLIEKRLNALGINSYEQIANWTNSDIDRVSQVLEFKGRIERETWVEQARILYSGGQTEFSRRVDRGEVDTSRDT